MRKGYRNCLLFDSVKDNQKIGRIPGQILVVAGQEGLYLVETVKNALYGLPVVSATVLTAAYRRVLQAVRFPVR